MTKAVFHVTRGPTSLPSFVNDVGQAFGAFVNAESDAFAAGQGGTYPFVSAEGGKEALLADLAEFTMGSDHEVYTDGTFGIPAIYLNDWPDRYIHTNFDTPSNIDPTKLQRAGFIGAASALFLANLTAAGVPPLWTSMKAAALRRAGVVMDRRAQLAGADGDALVRNFLATEAAAFRSIQVFAMPSDSIQRDATVFQRNVAALFTTLAPLATPQGEMGIVYQRSGPAGPMSVFGYDYFEDHAKGPRPRLLSFQGLRGSGSEYAYEVLNFASGSRTVRDIRDAVSAEYGPIPLDIVLEYLKSAEAAGVVRRSGVAQ